MRVSEKLIRRLREELNLSIPDDASLRRTFASRADRSLGAWSWVALDKSGSEHVLPRNQCLGSQFSMMELLESERLIVFADIDGDVHVCPAGG